jgi:glucose-6-phosphate 1-epimerase
MEIELWHGQTKAIVDPIGGWLTNLSDDNGDILFPARLLKAVDGSQKKRGGMHVCLPNFGPGGDSGLDQHGFGRTSTWEIEKQTDNSAVLVLKKKEGCYAGMVATLTYALGDSQLTSTLTIDNGGANKLRIAPGFHPYFTARGGHDGVRINNEKQKLDELGETVFIMGEQQSLAILGRHITLRSKNLTAWAVWTDLLGSYVCVEPTLEGYAFLKSVPSDNQMLAPGATKTYEFVMNWRA